MHVTQLFSVCLQVSSAMGGVIIPVFFGFWQDSLGVTRYSVNFQFRWACCMMRHAFMKAKIQACRTGLTPCPYFKTSQLCTRVRIPAACSITKQLRVLITGPSGCTHIQVEWREASPTLCICSCVKCRTCQVLHPGPESPVRLHIHMLELPALGAATPASALY